MCKTVALTLRFKTFFCWVNILSPVYHPQFFTLCFQDAFQKVRLLHPIEPLIKQQFHQSAAKPFHKYSDVRNSSLCEIENRRPVSFLLFLFFA